MLRQCHGESNDEITSELNDQRKTIVKHQAKFKAKWGRDDVIQLQLCAGVRGGQLEIQVNRMTLTRQLHHCYEHADQPITCFAEVAELKSRVLYQCIEDYQKTWLPILDMEAVTNMAKDADTIIIHNVPIRLEKHNDDYYGYLEFRNDFLKKRAIHFICHETEEEERSQDYLCLQIATPKRSCQYLPAGNERFKPYLDWQNYWTAHALITKVFTDKVKAENDDDDADSDGSDAGCTWCFGQGKHSLKWALSYKTSRQVMLEMG